MGVRALDLTLSDAAITALLERYVLDVRVHSWARERLQQQESVCFRRPM
jgi:hypothetical protein